MKRNLVFLTIGLLTIVLAPAGNARRAPSAAPKGRALLVGINQYQQHPAVRPTRGAEEDASETARFIQTQYGFRSDEIHTLLGPQATAAAIKAEFQRWLIEDTQPGDRVFFLYAGHGSQTKDLNGDEADGLDEVLAPYDVNWRGESFVNIILDDELDELTQQLPGRLAVLVFDSCNSGTITRGTPGTISKSDAVGDARYLPSPGEAKSLGIGVTSRGGKQAGPVEYAVNDQVNDDRILTTKSGASAPRQSEPQTRDLKLVDVKTQGTSAGHVIISAAQSNQSAYSMNISGKQRGALSFVFAEAHQGRVPTLGELRQQVTQRITKLQEDGSLRGKQRPSVEAAPTLENKPLFADIKTIIPEVAFANPQSKLKVTLRTRENKTTYKLGDDISYEVTTDAPGWLYLFVFSQEQKASFIFPNGPNQAERDNYVKAGTHRLPREDSFTVTPPCGKDVTVALLSSVDLKLGGKEEMTWQDVFDLLGNKKLTGYVRTRGVGVKKPSQPSRPTSLNEADWQAASLTLETTDHGSSTKCKPSEQ